MTTNNQHARNATPVPSAEEIAREWIENDANASIAGQKGDDALYNAACVLYHGFDLREGALDLLRHYNAVKCSPAWPEHRLAYKLRQAAAAPQKHKPGGLYRWKLRQKGFLRRFAGGVGVGSGGVRVANEPQMEVAGRLKFDAAKLAREVRDVPREIDAEWLAARSPVHVLDAPPLKFLDALYKPGEKVLIFTDFYSRGGDFGYQVGKKLWRLGKRPGVKPVVSDLPRGGRDGVWFLNQPVNGEWVPNPESTDELGRPRMSRRSQYNVTSWRYLVLESDEADGGAWLRFLVKLPLPICAIYTSGGRSIHALVRVDAPSKAWWDQYKRMLMPLLSNLGADPAAITAVRLTRLPGCMRGEREQRLLWLDPNPGQDEPILWRVGL